MAQIPLSYPVHQDYAAENFFVSPANEEAYRLIEAGEYNLYLYGEKGSGKTHLAHIWQQKHKGILIDNVEQYLPREEELFHLLNRAKEEGKKLLCTAQDAPGALGFKTRDVQSRLKGMVQVKIHAPDETLLKSLLAKQCTDRQLKVAPEVISYIASRIERSYTAIAECIVKLDTYALSTRREITIPLVREILNPGNL